MVGQTLAHYRIIEKIGSGGMGDVYLAEDTHLERKVALKVLPPELADNERRLDRFKREAKAIAALNHPNIITVHSVENADGLNFITMELVRGKTLRELIPRKGLSLDRFFRIAIPLVDAVAMAHREGITHRDLKPENVMVDDDGRVKVLDFGLAQSRPLLGADDNSPTQIRTQDGAIVGTVEYMSPEQAEGKALDGRADVFSLGVMFYELLTGELPFKGDSTVGILSAILTKQPRPVCELKPEIPASLGAVVERCLAKHPKDRYQQAQELETYLKAVRDDPTRSSRAEPAAAVSLKAGGKGLSCTLSLAIGFSAMILVGIGLHFLVGGATPDRASEDSSQPRIVSEEELMLRSFERRDYRTALRQAQALLTADPENAEALRVQHEAREALDEIRFAAAQPAPPTDATLIDAPPAMMLPDDEPVDAAPVVPPASSGGTQIAPSTSAPEQEEAAIRRTLANYERALETKNLELFRKIKPNLSDEEGQRLTYAFSATDRQEIELEVLSIIIAGDVATVLVNRSDTVVVRGQAQTGPTRRAKFVLQRSGNDWVITGME